MHKHIVCIITMIFSDTDEDETGDGGIISLSAALLGGCGDNVRAPRARALCGAPRNCNNQHNETIPLLLPCCVQLPCQLCQLRKNALKNTFTSKIL